MAQALEELQDLPQHLRQIAENSNLTTAEEVLTAPDAKLLLFESCSEADVRRLKDAAAKIMAERAVTVASLLKSPAALRWSRISFGCAALDRCCGGGIVTRGITEICGAFGVGKTQLLLQLALTVQLPRELGGLGKAAAFICTEDAFPSKRLFQIVQSFGKRFPQTQISYLNNIFIEHVLESEDLLKCITERLHKLMSSTEIGIIIIDSVAAVYRVKSDYIERAREMRKLANALLNYSHEHGCAVVCINQVTSVSEKQQDVPCLGLAWAHLGRTRFKVSKVPKQINIQKQLFTVRRLELLYSPEQASDYGEFLITQHGVVDVP